MAERATCRREKLSVRAGQDSSNLIDLRTAQETLDAQLRCHFHGTKARFQRWGHHFHVRSRARRMNRLDQRLKRFAFDTHILEPEMPDAGFTKHLKQVETVGNGRIIASEK
ncbi:hypothetical protein DIE16_33790 [Burkholderia sp. Bp9090]|nr:hypothetical protein DIE16_33790 [Burkholderia sp. Bp9090]